MMMRLSCLCWSVCDIVPELASSAHRGSVESLTGGLAHDSAGHGWCKAWLLHGPKCEPVAGTFKKSYNTVISQIMLALLA